MGGERRNEVGFRVDNGDPVVRIDPAYYRPAEVQTLLGDPSKAKKNVKLGSKLFIRTTCCRND